MFEQENIDSRTLTVIAVFIAVVLFVMALLIQVVFHRTNNEFAAKKALVIPSALADYTTEQTTTLQGYRWIDKEARIASIPIERAMQIERAALEQARK